MTDSGKVAAAQTHDASCRAAYEKAASAAARQRGSQNVTPSAPRGISQDDQQNNLAFAQQAEAEGEMELRDLLARSANVSEQCVARYFLGGVYLLQKKYQQALAEFEFCEKRRNHASTAEETVPFASVLGSLAYVHHKLGHTAEAARYGRAAGVGGSRWWTLRG